VKPSHTIRPVFDDPNLVSAAGLVPALRLAESAGFHDLLGGLSVPTEWASRSVRTASSKRSSRASVRVMPFTVPAGVTQSGVSRRRTREASLAPNAGQMEVHDLHSPMFPRPASPCSARDRRLSLDAETVQQHLSRCTLLAGQRTGRRLPRRDRSLALTQEQLPLGHAPRVVPPVLPSEPVPRGVRPGRGRALRPDRLRC
jgi:hypothetical protein